MEHRRSNLSFRANILSCRARNILSRRAKNSLSCRAKPRHLFLAAALALALASCGSILQKPAEESKYARVSVSVEGAQERTVFAEPVSLDALQFVLQGEGDAGGFSKTWESCSYVNK